MHICFLKNSYEKEAIIYLISILKYILLAPQNQCITSVSSSGLTEHHLQPDQAVDKVIKVHGQVRVRVPGDDDLEDGVVQGEACGRTALACGSSGH